MGAAAFRIFAGMRVACILILFLMALCQASSLNAQGLWRCDVDQRLANLWDAAKVGATEERLTAASGIVQLREPVIIPVVFHIVYRDPEQDISDVQIRSQLDIINRDFGFEADNLGAVPDMFYPLGGDAGLRFCLASVDPDGNPTSGITRTFTPVEHIGSDRQPNGRYSVHYNAYGGVDGWDPARYVNIWVAGLDGLLGTASLPGMAAYPEEDGIVIDPNFVGSVGLAASADPFDKGHTLTHELGHYFGLYHIWGQGNGSCDVDDMVDDTPEQEGPYLGCPEYPQFSCGSSDMFMNFMDFTSDRCLALFTRGQIARMQTALMVMRPGLVEHPFACDTPDTGKIGLDDAIIYYASGSNQIIVILGHENDPSHELTIFSLDGKLIASRMWHTGRTYWIDADGLPAGIYAVRLESGGEVLTQKVLVTP